MLRFADFYADRQQTTDDKPIALPLAAHARTRGNNINFGDATEYYYLCFTALPLQKFIVHIAVSSNEHVHSGYYNKPIYSYI